MSHPRVDNRQALQKMGIAVNALALYPAVIVYFALSDSPFLFAGAHNLLVFLLFVGLLRWKEPRLLKRSALKTAFLPPGKVLAVNKHVIPCVLSGVFTMPLFLFATRYIDIVAVMIIYGMWPIFKTVFLYFLDRKEQRYRSLSIAKCLFFLVGLVGFGFVTLGESPNQEWHIFGGNESEIQLASWIIGSLLALGAAFSESLSVPFSQHHGTGVTERLKQQKQGELSEVYAGLLSASVHRFVAAIVAFGVVIVVEQGEIASSGIWKGAAILAFVSVLATVSTRYALTLTNNPGITTLNYVTPILSICILYLASIVELLPMPEPGRFDFIFLGAVAVIAANLVVSAEAEGTAAWKGLIGALWICGTIVYLREAIVLEPYFPAMMSTATIFILILSFRINRLARQITFEEEKFLAVWNGLTERPEWKKLQNSLAQMRIAKDPEMLQNAHRELRKGLLRGASQKTPKRVPPIKLLSDIDTLAISRQQGYNFAELLVLFVVGAIASGGIMTFAPMASTGWGGLFLEVFAIFIPSSLIFLAFNVLDFHFDRARQLFAPDSRFSSRTARPTKPVPNEYRADRIKFREDPSDERTVSLGMCAIMTTILIALLYAKWIVHP